MPALPTTPKPSGPDADSSWLLDENLSPGLVQGSMQNLHLADSPLTAPLQSTAATNRASQPRASKPIKSRPSWGSAVVLDAQHSANAISGMRLLAGIQPNDENKPPVSRKPPTSSSSTAGAPARPRFSLFAKPGVPTNLVPKKPHNASTASQHDDDDDDDLTLHGLPDVSALASSSSHAPDASAASAYIPDDDYIRDALLGKPASAAVATGAPTPVESKESQEHAARQLAELRRINDVFEAFETSLRGSAGQINAFARRVRDTDDLLNIYISLLRQTEKTQQLLQDQDWKGTTKDAEAHKESLAIAHRETQRLHAEALAREQEAKRAASSRPSRQRNCSVVSRKRPAEQLDPALAAGVVALYRRVRGVRREVEWRVQLRHARRQNRPTPNRLRQLPLPLAAGLHRHQHAELQDPRPSPHAHPPAAQASAASTPTSRAPDTAHDSARPRLPLAPHAPVQCSDCICSENSRVYLLGHRTVAQTRAVLASMPSSDR